MNIPFSASVESPAKVLKISYGGVSSAGIKDRNEDAFAVFQPPRHIRENKGAVACVADGASCSKNAQLASETSVTTYVQDYLSTPESWDVKSSAAKVLSSLNSWLNYQGQLGLERHNAMVTTFSSIIFKSATAHILHTGDSRIYRLRKGELVQLTQDHIFVENNGNKVLTRALGMEPQLKVDYQKRSIRPGDIFILTSDGVHEFLHDREIHKQLAFLEDHPFPLKDEGSSTKLEKTAGKICNLAKENSDDNLTCLLIRVDDVPVENLEEAHRNLTRLVIPPALEPGQKIDGYAIKQVVHAGARSHVYLAEHERFRESFVIKVPSVNFSEDPRYLEAFVREQWVGRKISDPRVMKIHEPLPDSKFLYHICEHVPGITLRQWMYDNPEPDLSEVRRLTSQIIEGIRVFRRMRMLHRDLKPENIMVMPDGNIKLIDFGTVKVPGLEEMVSPLRNDSPVGSVDYIAPEYLMGDLGLHRSDLFSLGVIVYELLTGELPFKTLARKDGKANSYDQWQYIPAVSRRTSIPLWLDLALKKACTPRPTQRYQAMSEFLADITSPSQELIALHESVPLMEKDPIRFWQGMSLFLLVALLLQFALPYL